LGFKAGPDILDSKKKKRLLLPGMEPQFIGRLALSLIAVPNDLCRLTVSSTFLNTVPKKSS
jgi:hypothetical protein